MSINLICPCLERQPATGWLWVLHERPAKFYYSFKIVMLLCRPAGYSSHYLGVTCGLRGAGCTETCARQSGLSHIGIKVGGLRCCAVSKSSFVVTDSSHVLGTVQQSHRCCSSKMTGLPDRQLTYIYMRDYSFTCSVQLARNSP